MNFFLPDLSLATVNSLQTICFGYGELYKYVEWPPLLPKQGYLHYVQHEIKVAILSVQ